jgi:hypothetical protein
MTSIPFRGVIRDGKVEIFQPIDLPEGTEVVISAAPAITEENNSGTHHENATTVHDWRSLRSLHFMTEEEQAEDPASIQEWIDDLRSIPPLPQDLQREADWQAWCEKMGQFNLEATRLQFEKESP